jgi:hypothetical protein
MAVNKILLSGPIATVGNILPEIVNVPQNPDFTVKFNPGAFTSSLLRPTKTIVVSQDPAPGDFVPTGTPVTVTVVEKSIIPVSSFTGLTPAVVTQFKTIGDLETALANPSDPVANGAKAALDKGVPYSQLSTADQASINAFAGKITGVTDAAKAGSEISFMYQL